MLYLIIAVGLVSAFAVSGTNPNLPLLENEVAQLKTFANDAVSRINTSATYQVTGRMETALACWSIQLGNFHAQIDNAINEYLSDFLNKVKDMLAQTKSMTDDQIQTLAAQLYGSNDSVLIKVSQVEKDFSDRANTIYNSLMQLNKITCNSTVTATAEKP